MPIETYLWDYRPLMLPLLTEFADGKELNQAAEHLESGHFYLARSGHLHLGRTPPVTPK